MVLETDRLILRGWIDSDASSLFKYAKDPRVGFWAGWLPHRDENYSRAIIRTVLAGRDSYAICLKNAEYEPIGSISFVLRGTDERPLLKDEAELGYWIGVPFWGRGFATEASMEMIRYGFENAGLERIFCGYFEGNERSKAVQKKCGFTFHHINEHTKVIMLGETRREYINCITRDAYIRMK